MENPKSQIPVIGLIVVLCSTIFFIDVSLPLGVAGGVLYIAVVLVALWLPRHSHTFIVAGLCTGLIILAMWISPLDGEWWKVLPNRGLAILAVWVTTIISLQRKGAGERGRFADKKYRDLLERAPDSAIIVNDQGKITFVNTQTEQWSGYAREELVGQSVEKVIPERFYSQHTTHRREYCSSPSVRPMGIGMELHALRKDGSECPVEISLSPLTYENESLVFCSIRDITKQKDAASQLRLAKFMADRAPDAIFWVRPDARFMYVNASACEKLGYSQEELLTMSVTDIDPDFPAEVWQTYWPQLKEEKIMVMESRHRTKDGTVFPIELTSNYAVFEEQEYNCAIVRDISERKAAEKALRQSRETFDAFFENATLPMHMVDKDGIILRANLAELNMMGYRREEYEGRHIATFHVDQDVIEAILSQLLGGKTLTNNDARLRHKDGSFRYVLISSSGQFEDGQFLYTRCFTRDITERKRSEDLQNLQKVVLEKVITSQPLLPMLELLCLHVEQIIPSAICSILLLDEQTGSLKFGAGPSASKDYAAVLDGMIPGNCMGSCGTAIYRGETVIATDTAQDPLWSNLRDVAKKHKIGACWSIPIFSEGRAILGSFAISHPQPHSPTAFDFQLLAIVSHLAGITIQRRRSEEQLQESEARFRDLYVSAPLAYFSVAMNGNILAANTKAVELLGYSKEELIGQPVLDLYASTALGMDNMKRVQEQIAAGQEIQGEELEMQKADGSHLWVNLTIHLIQDRQGQFIERRCIVEDISGRKLVQEALHASEQRFRSVVQLATDAIILTDYNGNIIAWNQSAEIMFGYTQQEVMKNPLMVLIPLRYQASYDKGLRQSYELSDLPGETFELSGVAKGGKEFPIEVSLGTWQSDAETFYFGIIRDITQRKQAEEKIQEINMALSNAMPGIAHINSKGIYLEVNDSYADMLGYESHELIDQSWEPTVDSEDLPSAHVAYQVMLQTGKGEFEAKAIRKDGSTFYKHVLMVKKVDKNGELIGHHCFMRDISERKLSEVALRESEGRLQGILDNSSAVIYVKDLQGKYILINREYERIFNLDRAQVQGKTDFDLFPLEIAKAFTDNDQKVLEHGDSMEWEEMAPQKDGLHTYISNKFPLQNSNGTRYAICGISTDITQRKQAEAASQRFQDFLQHILHSLSAHIAILNASGIILDVNDAWRQFAVENHLATPNFGIGMNYVSMCSTEFAYKDTTAAAVGKGIQSLLAGKSQYFEAEYACHSEDEQRWFRLQATAFVGQDGLNIVMAHENITKLVLSEEALRASGLQFQALSHQLLTIQETERRHLARELHDEIGQSLTALKLIMKQADRLPDPANKHKAIHQGIDVLDQTIQQVRQLSLDLRPAMLDDLGLFSALKWLVERAQKTGEMTIHFQGGEPEIRAKPDIELACYRVAQEALTNVLRHAKANEVHMELHHTPQELKLTVRDNGIGFSFPSYQSKDLSTMKVGLLGMKERVKNVGGQFSIQSTLQQGTTIKTTFPLRED